MLVLRRVAGSSSVLCAALLIVGCTDRHTWRVNTDPCAPQDAADEGLHVVAYTTVDGDRHPFAGRVHLDPNGNFVLEPERRSDDVRVVPAAQMAALDYDQPNGNRNAFLIGFVIGLTGIFLPLVF